MFTREDILAVAIRLIAIWIGCTVLIGTFRVLSLAQTDVETELVPKLIVLVVSFVILAGVWLFPVTIARKLLPAAKDAQSPLQADPHALVAVGFTVLGLYWLGDALIGLFYGWSFLRLAESVGDGMYLIPPDISAGLWTDGFQAALGIAVMLSAKTVQRWLLPPQPAQLVPTSEDTVDPR
ncbi:hypothetical protein C7S18_23230 [Ahniella affigens]|uniref:Uncharacterized protein n=1 Tax=Ahniella affigens TaxID=2021234 RepID=A0A2P1PYI7_9GAMM|nr:hypothetical protein [Ahniella affigens]AVP99909.1 hypothetical protein C7S18_23230 [Ahniella affigens]